LAILTVIIPVFNEKNTILEVINKIKAQNYVSKQVIIVDDGSTDGTQEILLSNNSDNFYDLILLTKNSGKGAAIRKSIPFIKGDIVLIQDGDLEYDPSDYKKLIEPILNLKSKVVYGSRVLGKKRYNVSSTFFYLTVFANHFLTFLSNILNQQKLTDAHTCYKVFDVNVFRKIVLKEDDFSFCPEITTKISNMKIEISEVPINYYGRHYKDGKKIKFTDVFKAIWVLFKYKFLDK
jgi:glycosyltransferase involved in cell wall biosynthesis